MTRRVLAAVLAAVALAVLPTLSAAPAAAGGPTHVLLASPGTGATTTLEYVDPAYQDLSRLLGIGGATQAVPTPKPSGIPAAPSVVVIWELHGVTPWRIDRVYLPQHGAVVVATAEAMSGDPADLMTGDAVWHAPSDGKELVTLLDRLGLLPSPAEQLVTSAASPAPTAAAEVAPRDTAATESRSREAATAQPSPGPGYRPLLWGLAGLAAGILGTLGLSRLAAGRRPVPSPAGPLDPAFPVVAAADDAGWSRPEELSAAPLR